MPAPKIRKITFFTKITDFILSFFRTVVRIIMLKIKLIMIVLGLIGALLISLQFSWVQTELGRLATEHLSESTGFPMKVEQIEIKWLDRAILKNVEVLDKQKQKIIFVEELDVNYDLIALIRGKDIILDKVRLKKAEVQLVDLGHTLNINEWLDALTGKSDPNDTTKSDSKFIIREAELVNSFFGYHVQGADSVTTNIFDPSHFSIKNLNGVIKDFTSNGDTLSLQTQGFSGLEPRLNFTIEEFSTKFSMHPTEMKFTELYGEFGNTVLADSMVFTYESMDKMTEDFVKNVHLDLNLNSVVISTKDLALFAPDLELYHETMVMQTGRFRGKINDFTLKNLDLRFGQQSVLKGNLKMKDLMYLDTAKMEINLKNSKLHASDLIKFLPKDSSPTLLKLGDIYFDTEFVGTIKEFVSKGNYRSDLGILENESKLNLNKESYEVSLNTKDFDLGKLLNNALIGKITSQNKVLGSGFDLEKLSTNIDSKIDYFYLNHYNYKNIDFKGKIDQKIIESKINVLDSNLQMIAEAKLDLNKNTLILDADLDTAFLHKLKLMPQDAFLKTQLRINLKDLQFDNLAEHLAGSFALKKVYFAYNHKDIELKQFTIKMLRKKEEQRATISSDIFDAEVRGNFTADNLLKDFATLAQEYDLFFTKNDTERAVYYAQKAAKKEDEELNKYEVKYSLRLKNINEAVNMFVDNFYVSPNVNLRGTFNSAYNKNTDFSFSADSMAFEKNNLQKVKIVFGTSKLSDQAEVKADLVLSSQKQHFGNLSFENFNLEAHLDDRTINFKTFIKDENSDNRVDIKADLFLLDSSKFLFDLHPSEFHLIGEKWINPDSTLITVQGQEVNFKNVIFSNGHDFVEIKGDLSKDKNKVLEVKITDLELEIFKNILGFNFEGNINGTARLQDVYDSLEMSINLKVDSIEVDNFEIGDLSLQASWLNVRELLTINSTLTQNKKELMLIYGTIHPSFAQNQLNLHAQLYKADMTMIEPFVKDNLSEIDGFLTGKLRITGNPSSPIIKGNLDVQNGKIKVNYLNTVYRFDDRIFFENDHIGVKNFKFRDAQGDLAIINGGIYHDGVENILIQVEGTYKKFQVLNTEPDPNTLYYGTANITGDFKVFGSPKSIDISANVITEKNTKLSLPLDGYADVQKENSFIRFKEKPKVKKTTTKKKKKKKITTTTTTDSVKNIQTDKVIKKEKQSENDTETEIVAEKTTESGMKMKMNFNVDITPDAAVEIIFNKKAGDIMKANGKGKLRVEMDTEGEFKMFGDLDIVKGAYNFTFLNIVNKEFIVGPDSRISWTGDPFGGTTDIKALYMQRASLAPIIDIQDTTIKQRPEIRRRYPVKLSLFVKGKILSPEVKFGIDILDYPTVINAGSVAIPLDTYVNSFKAKLDSDEQELAKQVFSLMVLKQFSAQNAFSGLGQSAGRSVSELLTNQLSNWMSQVDDKLEVQFDLNGLDADALRTMELRLSYSFMGGRMRITRDGGFTNVQNKTSASSVIGDWTVEYLVTLDGKVRLKMYHRNTANTLNPTLSNTSVQGVSVLYTRSFNTLKELFSFFYEEKKPLEIEKE